MFSMWLLYLTGKIFCWAVCRYVYLAYSLVYNASTEKKEKEESKSEEIKFSLCQEGTELMLKFNTSELKRNENDEDLNVGASP